MRVQYDRNDSTTWTFECLVDPGFASDLAVTWAMARKRRGGNADDYMLSVRDGVMSISYLDRVNGHAETVPLAPDA